MKMMMTMMMVTTKKTAMTKITETMRPLRVPLFYARKAASLYNQS